jgi:SAM-dependent methyltransferase
LDMPVRPAARKLDTPADLATLACFWACPTCRGPLVASPDLIRCTACGAGHALHAGIPLFARFGSAEAWSGADRPARTSEDYQREYQRRDAADGYNAMYSERWHKRWITRREQALLGGLLASQPRSTSLLDLPSGGGRLSAVMAPHTELLLEADIALGQLLHGREHQRVAARQLWLTASGFHIPLRDRAVDGVVCVRLNHHLPTADERERLLAELLRVARRFVVMTFFDHHSLKNWLRRARAPFDGKPSKMTMSVARVRELAAEGGFDLVAWPTLMHLGSGHRYALLVRRDA